MGEFVRLEVDGAIGTIRLDRPLMNALNRQIEKELREAAVEATERTDVRAVVVYGGEKVFDGPTGEGMPFYHRLMGTSEPVASP